MQRRFRGCVPGGPPLPEFLPAIGPRRARVALFTGCVADAIFRQTHWATARVLQHNGCDVVTPRDQVCCGAIHYHSGADAPAMQMAQAKNAAAFDAAGVDAVIVNVAGCGSMLKDYGHIAHEARHDGKNGMKAESLKSLALAKMKDVSEFLAELGTDSHRRRNQTAGRLPGRLPSRARAAEFASSRASFWRTCRGSKSSPSPNRKSAAGPREAII